MNRIVNKRKLLWWASTIAILIGIIWLAGNNHGYVLIIRSPYRIQISFNFLLAVFVISLFGLHYCLRLLHFLRRYPENKQIKKNALSLKASNAALLEAMNALADGDEDSAKSSLLLAQQLTKNNNIEHLIQKLSTGKSKQGALFSVDENKPT